MVEPLRIGPLEITPPVITAPMCGYSDLPFRRIHRAHGTPLLYAEMVKDMAVLLGNKQTLQLLATDPDDRPLGLQLAGREPEKLAEAAKILEGRGAAVIDFNIGCPVPKLIGKGCCAALLKEPEQVGRCISALAKAVTVPVTAKMRIGFDAEPDGTYLDVARIIEDSGAAALTVHGRTRKQRFTGVNDPTAIARVKEILSIPVIGNGDIRCGEDAKRMMEETKCDGVMVARGTLGNPWLVPEIGAVLDGRSFTPPEPADRARVLREHFAHILDCYRPYKAFRQARHVIHAYIKGLPGVAELRRLGTLISTEEDFEVIARAYETAAAKAD